MAISFWLKDRWDVSSDENKRAEVEESFAALDFVTSEISQRMRQCQPLPWRYDAFLSSGGLLGKFHRGTLWKWGPRMLDMECSYYRPIKGLVQCTMVHLTSPGTGRGFDHFRQQGREQIFLLQNACKAVHEEMNTRCHTWVAAVSLTILRWTTSTRYILENTLQNSQRARTMMERTNICIHCYQIN